ncbi:MAG TPA: tRNA (adenosine(37)-N6)-threonylcarbamoyltransferase complex ATPase subunit type 1 TsaE [Dehalococcoidia bacterium]|nr:tRNA (adenosine(37)-N6)-threonylcarbamoyltransferase complex ATPase subunit type 1 TsaE [Dehalococcoidia bacterium]
MKSLRFESASPAETRRLGERLARFLRAGDVVLLSGELGAGKTCFAQGIGKGLRVAEPVKSSSFVLVNEYHGRLHVHHADLFRLNDPGEVADLALEENAADGVLLVEWPDRAWEEMPPERLLVRFEFVDDRRRLITLEATGRRYEDLLAGLAAASKSEAARR